LRVSATQLAKRHVITEADRQAQWGRVDALLQHKCPDEQGWLKRPEVNAALGRTWYDLMHFEQAIPCLENAIRGEQEKGAVPIRAVELLVNALTRRGQQLARAGQHSAADALVASGLVWLDRLDAMAASKPGETTAERRNLRGSAYKRRADVRASLLMATTGAARDAVRRDLRATIRRAIEIYEESAAKAKDAEKPYPQLNALALRALECKPDEAEALSVLAAQAGKAAHLRAESAGGSIWDHLMTAEAETVAWLLAGPDPAKTNVDRDRVIHAHEKVLRAHPINPAQCDSVCTQLDLLECLAQALGKTELVKRLKVVKGLVKAGVKHD
jgi:tetratricopeptide (TPR) repeat protein